MASLWNCVRLFSGSKAGLRHYSVGASLLKIDVNSQTGVAVVSMQKPPVNSLNLELLQALGQALDELEANKSRGMILTSECPSVFSGGLDILEMYKPKPDRLKLFWTALQQAWLKLYGSSFPTVAAINGHSPAGGCLLALSCEYRVLVAPKYTIGLNETKLGITAPKWFQDSMRNVIGQRQTEVALTTGKLFTAEEALKVGLVDELASDKADAIAKAERFLKQFDVVSAMARTISKLEVRRDTLNWLKDNLERDLQEFVQNANRPEVQHTLGKYMEGLKKK